MLLQIQPIPPTPDAYFWYAVAGLLLLALITLSGIVVKLLREYAGKTESAIEKLVDVTDRHGEKFIEQGNALIRISTRQEFNETRIHDLEKSQTGLADQIVTKLKAMNGE